MALLQKVNNPTMGWTVQLGQPDVWLIHVVKVMYDTETMFERSCSIVRPVTSRDSVGGRGYSMEVVGCAAACAYSCVIGVSR